MVSHHRAGEKHFTRHPGMSRTATVLPAMDVCFRHRTVWKLIAQKTQANNPTRQSYPPYRAAPIIPPRSMVWWQRNDEKYAHGPTELTASGAKQTKAAAAAAAYFVANQKRTKRRAGSLNLVPDFDLDSAGLHRSAMCVVCYSPRRPRVIW